MPSGASAQYEAALTFLYGRINYEQSAATDAARDFILDRTRRLLELVDNPQRNLPIVHIAGTKGKGSTAALVGSCLNAAGFHVGLYTSPHLERVEERLAVNGQSCTAEELVELTDLARPAIEIMDRESDDRGTNNRPTFFEITTALALLHFRRRKVDAVVLEVGLGGRLDSTNVCEPAVTVITNISLDHTRLLGSTLRAIATEKAGIIKPGVPIISGVVTPEPREAIAAIARERGAPLYQLGKDFRFEQRAAEASDQACFPMIDFRELGADAYCLENARVNLLGSHQAANAAVALAALCRLKEQGWDLPSDKLRAGLASVRIPARIEVVALQPTVILDAAHNVASVEALADVLDQFTRRKATLIFSASRDKDARGMLRSLLPKFQRVILTQPRKSSRATPPNELVALARQLSGELSLAEPELSTSDDPGKAWSRALADSGRDDLVCITGSFFLAAELREVLCSPTSPSTSSELQQA